TTVQKKALTYTVGDAQARFSRMKSTSKKRIPSIVNLTVKRRYLTQREIDRLMDCAFGGTDDGGADDSRTSTSTGVKPRSSRRLAPLIDSPSGVAFSLIFEFGDLREAPEAQEFCWLRAPFSIAFLPW